MYIHTYTCALFFRKYAEREIGFWEYVFCVCARACGVSWGRVCRSRPKSFGWAERRWGHYLSDKGRVEGKGREGQMKARKEKKEKKAESSELFAGTEGRGGVGFKQPGALGGE